VGPAGGTPALAPASVVAAVADWAGRIEAAADAGRAARALLDLLAAAVRATRGSILVRDPDSGALMLLAGLGLPALPRSQALAPQRRRISDHVLREQKSLLLHGAVRDERFDASAGTDRLSSAMSLPLFGQGGAMGILNLSRLEPAARFTEEELASIELTTAAIGTILERMLELARARAAWRRLVARPPQPEWPRTVADAVALSIVPGTAGAPDLCEHCAHADGAVTILLAEPFGHAVESFATGERLRGAFHALAMRSPGMGPLAESLDALFRERWPGASTRAWLGRLSRRGELRSCAAGYPAPFWLPFEGDSYQRWHEGGPPLGTADRPGSYAESSFRMVPGDLCVVLSDGVLAAGGPSGRVAGEGWSEPDLAEHLRAHRREPMDVQASSITSAALERMGHARPTDDLVALALRHTRD
jgi:hypothetical protein